MTKILILICFAFQSTSVLAKQNLLISADTFQKLASEKKSLYIKSVQSNYIQFEKQVMIGKELASGNILFNLMSPATAVADDGSPQCLIGGQIVKYINGKCSTRGYNCGSGDSFQCGTVFGGGCVSRTPVKTLSDRCAFTTEAFNPDKIKYSDLKSQVETVYDTYCSKAAVGTSSYRLNSDACVALDKKMTALSKTVAPTVSAPVVTQQPAQAKPVTQVAIKTPEVASKPAAPAKVARPPVVATGSTGADSTASQSAPKSTPPAPAPTPATVSAPAAPAKASSDNSCVDNDVNTDSGTCVDGSYGVKKLAALGINDPRHPQSYLVICDKGVYTQALYSNRKQIRDLLDKNKNTDLIQSLAKKLMPNSSTAATDFIDYFKDNPNNPSAMLFADDDAMTTDLQNLAALFNKEKNLCDRIKTQSPSIEKCTVNNNVYRTLTDQRNNCLGSSPTQNAISMYNALSELIACDKYNIDSIGIDETERTRGITIHTGDDIANSKINSNNQCKIAFRGASPCNGLGKIEIKTKGPNPEIKYITWNANHDFGCNHNTEDVWRKQFVPQMNRLIDTPASGTSQQNGTSNGTN